jgi:hypothetical protein
VRSRNARHRFSMHIDCACFNPLSLAISERLTQMVSSVACPANKSLADPQTWRTAGRALSGIISLALMVNGSVNSPLSPIPGAGWSKGFGHPSGIHAPEQKDQKDRKRMHFDLQADLGPNSEGEQCARRVRETERESRRQEASTRRGGDHTRGRQAWHTISAAVSKEEIVSLRLIPTRQSRSSPAWHNLGSVSHLGNPTIYPDHDDAPCLSVRDECLVAFRRPWAQCWGSKASTP